MSGTDSVLVKSNGAYIDLGGLWVRYDTVGTIKEINPAVNPTDMSSGPYCQVVLNIPGYKTLGVGCTAAALLSVIAAVEAAHEFGVGQERAKGMRV